MRSDLLEYWSCFGIYHVCTFITIAKQRSVQEGVQGNALDFPVYGATFKGTLKLLQINDT